MIGHFLVPQETAFDRRVSVRLNFRSYPLDVRDGDSSNCAKLSGVPGSVWSVCLLCAHTAFISHHFLWDSLSKTRSVKFTVLLPAPATIPALQAGYICGVWVSEETTQQHSFLLLELGQTMTARGWWRMNLHQPSRMGQEVLSSVANLPFAENFRNFMRMHTDFQDDVTSLLMWNFDVAVREPLGVQEPWCGMPPWVCVVGHSVYQDCCHWPKSSGWKNTGMLCDGLWNCKEKDRQSEGVWVTGILFWVFFSWCSREKPKLTGSWAAVFYIFLWWCLFGVFFVVLVMVSSHTFTLHWLCLEESLSADLLHTCSPKCEFLHVYMTWSF